MTASGDLRHHPLVMSLGWTLLHLVWQGALVGLLLAGVLMALRRASANARYCVACMALLVLAACPCVTFALLMDHGGRGDAALPRGIVLSPSIVVRSYALTSGRVIPSLLPTVATRTQSVATAAERFLPLLSVLWCVGVVLMALRLLGGWIRMRRLRCREVRPLRGDLQERCAIIARRMGITRSVELLESALIEVPSTFGWLRTVVLLPAGMLSGMSPGALEALLVHELAHIRRHDYLVNLLQTALETLLFYHPATWWISRQIRLEREYCCDDLAVMVLGDRNGYAKALAALEVWRQSVPAPVLSATGGELLPRLHRVLGASARQTGSFPGGILPVVRATCIVTALFLLSAVTLALSGASRRGVTATMADRSMRRNLAKTLTALLGTAKPKSQRIRAGRQVRSAMPPFGAATPVMAFSPPLIKPDLVALRHNIQVEVLPVIKPDLVALRNLQVNILPGDASINSDHEGNDSLQRVQKKHEVYPPADDGQAPPVQLISLQPEAAMVSAPRVAPVQIDRGEDFLDTVAYRGADIAGEEVSVNVAPAAEPIAYVSDDINQANEQEETQGKRAVWQRKRTREQRQEQAEKIREQAEQQAERIRERVEQQTQEQAERTREQTEQQAERIRDRAEQAQEQAERAIEQAERAEAQVERAIEQARRTREQEEREQGQARRDEERAQDDARERAQQTAE